MGIMNMKNDLAGGLFHTVSRAFAFLYQRYLHRTNLLRYTRDIHVCTSDLKTFRVNARLKITCLIPHTEVSASPCYFLWRLPQCRYEQLGCSRSEAHACVNDSSYDSEYILKNVNRMLLSIL